MNSILILADDLTGAADTASRCRAAGLTATIFLTAPRPPLPAGVVAFTSDSRHLPPQAAARRVAEVATPLAGVDALWYKKIDSTLRGNIGAELDALLDVLGAPVALICPAFPAQGRGLVNGKLMAPGGPRVGVHLPSLLQEQSRHPVQALSLVDVRSGELAERFQRRGAEGQRGGGATDAPRLLVVDAQTEEDLAAIVDAAVTISGVLLCGSAGLIGEVARRGKPDTDLPGFGKPGRSVSGVLVVVGSGSEMAHRQINGLLTAYPSAIGVTVEPGHTPDIPTDARRLLLHQPPPPPGAVLDGPEARQRAALLADVALAQIERSRPGLLLLVGGDTAVGVLSRLGVEQLRVQAELLPGMPLCVAKVGGRALRVVMKPGSFGDDNALVELLAKVKRET